jgi:hypothetical protein
LHEESLDDEGAALRGAKLPASRDSDEHHSLDRR